MDKQEQKEVVFVSRMVGQSFSMPLTLLNPDTGKREPVYQKSADGSRIIINNRYVPEVKYLQFTNISRSARLGYYSEFKTADPEEIAYLEGLCKDPSNPIIRLDTYKKERNPEMFRAEQERDRLKDELGKEIMERDLKLMEKEKQISANESILADLRAKIQRLEQRNR